MAEEEKDQKKENPDAKKSKFPVMIVVIVICAVLVIAGASAAFFMVLGSKTKGKDAARSNEETRQEYAAKKDARGGGKGGEAGAPSGAVRPLDPFIVNLADAQGQRYLKAVIQIETDNPAAEAEITEKMPLVRDEILMILSNKTFDDVATVSGKRMLKREIASAVNRYLGSGQVTNVFFTEFVVQ
jgi:flagellar FliL protein